MEKKYSVREGEVNKFDGTSADDPAINKMLFNIHLRVRIQVTKYVTLYW